MKSSLLYIPCRSGSPHAVFGCVQVLDCAAAETAVSVPRAMTTASINMTFQNRWPMRLVLLFVRLFSEMPVDEFFREFHTLEFSELCILFLAPIEGKSDFPWMRKNRFVVDCSFVIKMIGIGEAVAFQDAY